MEEATQSELAPQIPFGISQRPENQRVIVSESQVAEPSFFHSSRNVVVHGGQFSSVAGSQASVVINVHHHPEGAIEERVAEHIPLAAPSQGQPQLSHEFGSQAGYAEERVPSRSQPLPIQKGSEIYYRHLSVKALGYPLWMPEPNAGLPTQYQVKGVSIGDVGIITPSGSFDFLFNICLPVGDPINPEELPEHFTPIDPPLKPIDTLRQMEFKPYNYLASSSIERSQRDGDSTGLTFETSASEGAILTMPQGAYSEDLGNVTRFRKYLAANAEHWYRYVNGTRGREAQNGDVRLVIGCHKSSAWGIAAFSNRSERSDFRLKFKPSYEEHQGPRTYAWEYSGMAEVRAGPAMEEIEELRNAHGDSSPGGAYRNQCLFIRTLNVTMHDDVWRRLNSELNADLDGIDHSHNQDDENRPDGTNGTNGGLHGDMERSSSSLGKSSNLNSPSSSARRADSSMESDGLPTLSRTLTDHPSKAINKMLLRKNPKANMAITEDWDWISVLNEHDKVLPNAKQLCGRIRLSHTVLEEDGVVFLKPRTDAPRSYKGLTIKPSDKLPVASPENEVTSQTSEIGVLRGSPALDPTKLAETRKQASSKRSTSLPRRPSSPIFFPPPVTPPQVPFPASDFLFPPQGSDHYSGLLAAAPSQSSSSGGAPKRSRPWYSDRPWSPPSAQPSPNLQHPFTVFAPPILATSSQPTVVGPNWRAGQDHALHPTGGSHLLDSFNSSNRPPLRFSGPVNTPISVRALVDLHCAMPNNLVWPKIQINPLIEYASGDTADRVHLKWNMTFPASRIRRSDEGKSAKWTRGRNEPATFPQLPGMLLVSESIPWRIQVEARNTELGVTCGEILECISQELSRLATKEEYATLSAEKQRELCVAYAYNRSQEPDVPGGMLLQGMQRLDFLGRKPMFAGIENHQETVKKVLGEVVPFAFVLKNSADFPKVKGTQLTEEKA